MKPYLILLLTLVSSLSGVAQETRKPNAKLTGSITLPDAPLPDAAAAQKPTTPEGKEPAQVEKKPAKKTGDVTLTNLTPAPTAEPKKPEPPQQVPTKKVRLEVPVAGEAQRVVVVLVTEKELQNMTTEIRSDLKKDGYSVTDTEEIAEWINLKK